MTNPAIIDEAHGDAWSLFNGDSCDILPTLPDNSVDFSCFSPPFLSVYTYSPTERDLGNCKGPAQFFEHFSFITKELVRLIKPGRIMAVHVANLPLYQTRDGVAGLYDFRGDCIRHFQEHGFVYHAEATIQKNPQAQAIRTKARGLLFVQLKRDASWMRQATADYIVAMRAPGDNAVPVKPDISQEEWIRWAHPVWSDVDTVEDAEAEAALWEPFVSSWQGIRETDVLQVHGARENDDEKHLCPLQLSAIERCVRLWTNPGEVVLSPFAGIGSEGYQSLLCGRKFVGSELKPSYFKVAASNLRAAEAKLAAPTLLGATD